MALTLARFHPKDHPYRALTETLYRCLCAQPMGELRKALMASLRQAAINASRAVKARIDDRRGQIPDQFSLHLRPRRLRIARFRGSGRVTSSRAKATPAPWHPGATHSSAADPGQATASQTRHGHPHPAGLYRQTPWSCLVASPQFDLRSGQDNGLSPTTHQRDWHHRLLGDPHRP